MSRNMKFGRFMMNWRKNCVRNVVLSQKLTAFRRNETKRLCTTDKFNADKIDVDMSNFAKK